MSSDLHHTQWTVSRKHKGLCFEYLTHYFHWHLLWTRRGREQLFGHCFSLLRVGSRQDGFPAILVYHHGGTRVDVRPVEDGLTKLLHVPRGDRLRVGQLCGKHLHKKHREFVKFRIKLWDLVSDWNTTRVLHPIWRQATLKGESPSGSDIPLVFLFHWFLCTCQDRWQILQRSPLVCPSCVSGTNLPSSPRSDRGEKTIRRWKEWRVITLLTTNPTEHDATPVWFQGISPSSVCPYHCQKRCWHGSAVGSRCCRVCLLMSVQGSLTGTSGPSVQLPERDEMFWSHAAFH